MLSPVEFQRSQWGDEFRRVLTAAASLQGIYTLDDMAKAFGITTGALRGWWRGARPHTERLGDVASATRLDRREVVEWVHFGGPRPKFP